MKKKKIIISILLFVIGILVVIISIIFKDDNIIKNGDRNNYLIVSNLQITSDNSLTVDITNKSPKKIENKTILLAFTNEKKKVIMTTPIEINNLDANKTETIEYYQEYVFETIPSKVYVKSYNKEEKLIENISLESKLIILLENKAKEIIEKEYNMPENLELKLTLEEMESKYKIDIKDFTKEKYKCSLTETYIDITISNYKYEYTPYLSCKIFEES